MAQPPTSQDDIDFPPNFQVLTSPSLQKGVAENLVLPVAPWLRKLPRWGWVTCILSYFLTIHLELKHHLDNQHHQPIALFPHNLFFGPSNNIDQSILWLFINHPLTHPCTSIFWGMTIHEWSIKSSSFRLPFGHAPALHSARRRIAVAPGLKESLQQLAKEATVRGRRSWRFPLGDDLRNVTCDPYISLLGMWMTCDPNERFNNLIWFHHVDRPNRVSCPTFALATMIQQLWDPLEGLLWPQSRDTLIDRWLKRNHPLCSNLETTNHT